MEGESFGWVSSEVQDTRRLGMRKAKRKNIMMGGMMGKFDRCLMNVG